MGKRILIIIITILFLFSCGSSKNENSGKVVPPEPTIKKFESKLVALDSENLIATLIVKIEIEGKLSEFPILTIEDNGIKIFKTKITSTTSSIELNLPLLFQRNVLRIYLTYKEMIKENLIFADIKPPAEEKVDFTKNVSVAMKLSSSVSYSDSIHGNIQSLEISYHSPDTDPPNFSIESVEYSQDFGKTWLLLPKNEFDYVNPATGEFSYKALALDLPKLDTGKVKIIVKVTGAINGQVFTKYAWGEIDSNPIVSSRLWEDMIPVNFQVYPDSSLHNFVIMNFYIGIPENHDVILVFENDYGTVTAKIDQVTYQSVHATLNARPLSCDPGSSTSCTTTYNIKIYLDDSLLAYERKVGTITVYK